MKRNEQNVSEILDRFLKRLGEPASPQDMETAGKRVLQRLRSEPRIDSAHQPSFSDFVPAKKRTYWMALAGAAALVVMTVLSISVIRRVTSINAVHATVENAGGGLSRKTDGKTLSVQAGERIESGDVIQSSDGAGAVLSLSDGSRIEMRSKSELSLQRAADGIAIRLDEGTIIVTAAKQRDGHLYVNTKDCAVSVVGTVFLVETSNAGSRVTVIQGEVQVRQDGIVKRLLPGDQTTTAPQMEPLPLLEEFRWSRYWAAYLTSLQQAGVVPSSQLKFATASIRRESDNDNSDSSKHILACHGIDSNRQGSVEPNDSFIPPKGECVGRRIALAQLVAYAYGVPRNRVHAPSHDLGEFRVEAKAQDTLSTTTQQLRQMLQTLLNDQFKLRFHSETRETPGYVLFIAKGGTRLKSAAAAEPPVQLREGNRFIVRGKSSMRDFAEFLSKRVLPGEVEFPAPVLDKTELTGTYDYALKWNASGGNTPIRNALDEQLGLRLEPLRIPMEVIVVDQAEPPSGN